MAGEQEPMIRSRRLLSRIRVLEDTVDALRQQLAIAPLIDGVLYLPKQQITMPTPLPDFTAIYTNAAGQLVYLDSNGIEVIVISSGAVAVSVRKTGTQSIANGANLVDVTFNVEDYDTDGMHAGSGTTLTAPVNGIYHIWGSVDWAAAVFPRAGTMIRTGSGAQLVTVENESTGSATLTQALSVDAYLLASQTVVLTAWHTNAVGAQNINTLTNTCFGMHLVSAVTL